LSGIGCGRGPSGRTTDTRLSEPAHQTVIISKKQKKTKKNVRLFVSTGWGGGGVELCMRQYVIWSVTSVLCTKKKYTYPSSYPLKNHNIWQREEREREGQVFFEFSLL
jgi:hypothetical protein